MSKERTSRPSYGTAAMVVLVLLTGVTAIRAATTESWIADVLATVGGLVVAATMASYHLRR